MPATRRPWLGYVLMITGALLFVMNAATSRALQGAGLSDGTMTSARLTFGAVVLVVVVYASGSRLTLPRGVREWVVVLGFALCGLMLLQYFYLVAIARLPLGLALLIEFTAPLLVALFVRVVYRERVKARLWLALVLSLVGLALVARAWEGLAFDLVGILAAAAAAASLATYYLIGEHGVAHDSPLNIVAEAFIVGAIAFNLINPIWRLFDHDLAAPASLGGIFAEVEVPIWLLLAAFVLLGTAIPFVLQIAALQHLRATEGSLLGTLEPVGVTLLGWAWFHEVLTPVQVAGVVIVLVGIVMAQTARVAPPETHEPHLVT